MWAGRKPGEGVSGIPMKPIKVCCFCERWESGGIESFLYNILTRIDLSRIHVDIVAASLEKSIFTEPLCRHGVKFYELSGKQHNLSENHRLFAELMRTQRYDLIHLNLFHGLSLYYAHLAKQAGVPVRIAHSHNTALRLSVGKPLKLLLHSAAKAMFANSATDLWACSESAAEFLFSREKVNTKGFQFIPNGIDTERFRFQAEAREAVRTELGLTGKFVVGNIGRLCYQKNQSFLLKVFAELAKQSPESRLLLVGEGEDRPRLEKRAEQLGIADKVLFYGVADHVERLLWAMDMFVMPSRFEGLPVTGVEAQAAGLPCIFSENITEECKMTPLSTFLPLRAGSVAWKRAALELASKPCRRQEGARLVREAGFDIQAAAVQVQNYYIRSITP